MAALSLQAFAEDQDCKAVALKPSDKITKTEFTRCKGILIADAMCKGWNHGEQATGCVDHKTSLAWSASIDLTLREKGKACLIGEKNMDAVCGIN